MSAYVVSQETLHRVVRACDKFAFFYTDFPEIRHCNDLGFRLSKFNCDAVNFRYPNGPKEIPFYDGYVRPNVSDGQLLMSLECFLYQCDEGDFDEYDLFIKLVEVKERIKNTLISNLPEYKNAEWR